MRQRVHYLTLRVFYVSSLEKYGVALHSVISWHWRKALIYFLVSHRNCRVFISNKMKMAGIALTATS
ncbi:hypothetical protein D3C77_780280 [compost metagenome]